MYDVILTMRRVDKTDDGDGDGQDTMGSNENEISGWSLVDPLRVADQVEALASSSTRLGALVKEAIQVIREALHTHGYVLITLPHCTLFRQEIQEETMFQ